MQPEISNLCRPELLELREVREVLIDRIKTLECREILAEAMSASKPERLEFRRRGKTYLCQTPEIYGTPMYVDPFGTGRSWRGLGRQPKWFQKAIAQGYTRNELLRYLKA